MDALEPAISADGRFVAYVLRARTARVTPRRLRSSVMLWDRATGHTVLVSSGARGRPADGYASEPAVSADGTRVVFTSTAGNLARAKARGLPGVFLRDVRAGHDAPAQRPPLGAPRRARARRGARRHRRALARALHARLTRRRCRPQRRSEKPVPPRDTWDDRASAGLIERRDAGDVHAMR